MTSKENMPKRKMKHPSDMPMPRYELRWLRSVAKPHYHLEHGDVPSFPTETSTISVSFCELPMITNQNNVTVSCWLNKHS